MALLIFYLVLALGVSFICSILEASLLSMPQTYVKTLESRGSRVGKRLAKLKEDIDRPLAAILSLNTIAHTVGAAGVGAQAATVFGEGYFGVISAVLTLLILFVSEIIPKTLGAIYWKELAGFTANACQITITMLGPFVWVSKKLTDIFQRRENKTGTVSRDEFTTLAKLGFREGVIAENENTIIRNLFRFRKVHVKDIMTPRTVVGRLPATMTCEEAMKEVSFRRFSRIPIYGENPEEINGYVVKQQILEEVACDRHSTPLSKIRHPLRSVPEYATLADLFSDLFYHKEQIALVSDEFGSMSGVVTNEDLIETLLGLEIMDEFDEIEDMREFARKKWKERAENLGVGVLDGTSSE